MFWKAFGAAALVAVLALPMLQAQTIADVGGPANLPPAGFKGQQFVDSRGCVFLKAGYSGQTQWVPRVNGDHKVVCGYPPTFGAPAQVAVAEAAPPAAKPAPAPAPVPAAAPAKPATGAPVETVASKMMPAAPAATPVAAVAEPAPYAATAPAGYQIVTSPAIPPGKIGCFRSAPVAERVQLRGGGSVVVCTRGDGTTTGWRSPIYPAGSAVGVAQGDTVAVAPERPAAVPQVAAAPTYTIPKGYKLAWDDDRLNPQRGVGTAEGWAQQDQVWTRTVPARLVAADDNPLAANAPVYRSPARAAQVTVSSQSAPAPAAVTVSSKSVAAATTAAAPSRIWVQVGSFAVAENAQGAVGRLTGLGLPVGKSQISRGGKVVQVVLAGPFGSAGEAEAALRLARQAGFGDAFLR